MSSPRDRLLEALRAWLLDDAREQLARARAAADAEPVARVLARHAALRSPRVRELFEETRERGLLEGAELAATATWLREAYAAAGRARADARLAEAFALRVPHDSDHHPPGLLFERLCREPHVGRRRAFARSLEDYAPVVVQALRDGLSDAEEALDGARWLSDIPAPDRAEPSAVLDAARAALAATADVWAEVRDRLSHAASTPLEAWPDLLFALRAPRLDDLVEPRRRFRRLAEPLAALGVGDALSRRTRVEGAAHGAHRPILIPVAVPGDVRVIPAAMELGLVSEQEAAHVLGRALAIVWTHPALPWIVAWPEAQTVGRALGGLFAHLANDPAFAGRSGLGAADARIARETRVALELWTLRTAAATALAREHLTTSSYMDAAREILRDAWQVDVHPTIAAVASAPRGIDPLADLRALLWVAPLHGVLRERYDEDYWRNPRAAEPLRAAAERGPTLSVEAWAAELGADPTHLAGRYAELVR